MTPKKKTSTSTTLKLERKRLDIDTPPDTTSTSNENSNGDASTTPAKKTSFIAGGKNAGIVVNKETQNDGKYLCYIYISIFVIIIFLLT